LLDKAMCHQFSPVGSECIRFDDIGPGLDVFGMYFANELRIGDIQLVEASADENAFAIQHCSHRAIAHQRARFERGQKIWHKQKG
jgi:hypothetical protein